MTIGASGSASRFAGTPYVGSCGASRIVTGQHATCAATGTATAAATGGQTRRASSSVSGGARTTIPAVARTDRAKANDRAYQGSTTSIPTTARAMSGTPRTGRPDRCTTSTTTAITVARTIEGSGRTSTTKASRKPTATTARTSRSSPSARPSSTTRPTITAQFAPDTAVRWVSAVVSIAASVAGSSPLRSPIAMPRSSAAPGSGRSAVTATKACRERSVPASRPVGRSTRTEPRRNTTKAVGDPGSSCSTDAVPWTVLPAASRPGAPASPSGTTRTGTRSDVAPSAAVSVPVTDRAPRSRSRSSVTCTARRPPGSDRTAGDGAPGRRRPPPTPGRRAGRSSRRRSPRPRATRLLRTRCP